MIFSGDGEVPTYNWQQRDAVTYVQEANDGAKMKKLARLFKKAFTSITIMVIPHDNHRPVNLKVPLAGIVIPFLLAAVGTALCHG